MKIKISGYQMVTMLFLCRMFSTLTYSPGGKQVEGIVILAADLTALILALILSVPLLLLMRKLPDHNFLQMCDGVSKVFGNLVRGYFLILMWMVAVNTCTHFTNFMTNAVFIHASRFLIMVTFTAACAYGVYQGLEGIARATSLILILFLASVLLILVTSIPNIDWINLKPPVDSSWKEFFPIVMEGVSKTLEFVVLLVLFPQVKGSFTRISLGYLLFGGIGFLTIGGITVLILGDYTTQQMFPFYTIASMVESDVLQRLDALHMIIWVLVSYVKLTVYLLTVTRILQDFLPIPQKKLGFWIATGGTLLGAIFLGTSYAAGNVIYFFIINGIPTILAVGVIPILLRLFGKKQLEGISETARTPGKKEDGGS
ncbi:MAG: GerAB/ArcD/ProY family transporter [Massiliimalia sp.]|jgi:spore germination protein KB